MPLWRRDRGRRGTAPPSPEGDPSPPVDEVEPEPERPDPTAPPVPEVPLESAAASPPVAGGEPEASEEPDDAVEASVEPALEAVATELVAELPGDAPVDPAATTRAEAVPRSRGPAHARPESAESFTERAQLAMERLGEFQTGNGVRSPRPLPRVIAIANQKGGVGKTTTTINLGAALPELDYRVLVVDLDPQGNATSGLGIDTRNFDASMYDVIMRDAPIEDCIEPTSVQNLFVTPATIDLAGVEIELVSAFSRELKLKRAIDTVVDDFDFVLIDCPPSLGLLTVNGLAAATEVMVPIQCEYYALEGLSQLIRNVELVASNLNAGLQISAIVLTMFDARTRLAVEVADEVRSHFKDVVCRSIIPRTVRLSEAPSFGQPITVFDPSSRGAVAYRELAKEVSNGAPKRSG